MPIRDVVPNTDFVDLEWVNVPPELEEEQVRAVEAASGIVEVTQAIESTGNTYRAIFWRMLLGEMARQGMLKEIGEAGPTYSNAMRAVDTGAGGIPAWKCAKRWQWVVTPTEIRGALAVASEIPGSPDHEVPEDDFSEWLLEQRGIKTTLTPGELASISAAFWNERWLVLLRFMRGAAEHGGFELW